MDNALKIDDFSFNEEVHIDQYIESEMLVQKFDVHINQIRLTSGIKRKIVILCYNLYIDGEFLANSCDIIIFCRNIIATNGAVINVSGLDAKQNADKKITRDGKSGDNPDGDNADNLGPDNKPYEIDGANAGAIELYAEKITGDLKIIANGGNGGKGQDGDEGIQGRNGLSFPTYQSRPKVFSIINGVRLFIGEDGLPPGNNGNGANGGRGGNGGNINISISKAECIYENKAGKGGEQGYGGKAITSGGKKGLGLPWASYRFIYITHQKVGYIPTDYSTQLFEDEDFYNNELNGIDRSNEHGRIGSDGENGIDGISGIYAEDIHYFGMIDNLPSSFFRILLLETEFFYINNDYNSAADSLQWILNINYYVQSETIKSFEASKLSIYLEDESVSDFNSIFNKAAIYYNQINQNLDFFGNATNYVSLLDSEFIGDKIRQLHTVLSEFKGYINSVLNSFEEVSALEKVNRSVIDSNSKTIGELIIQNTGLSGRLAELNNEIKTRQNEISKFKNRILDKEQAFKRAVERAKEGCDLQGTLQTITKLVSVAVTIYTGVGAVGSAASLMSDSSSLLSDFNSLVEDKKPGVDLDSWNNVFNEGGDNSILERVKKLQSKGDDLKESVGLISDFVNNEGVGTKGNELVAIQFNPDNTTGFNKEDFVTQLKIFVNDFPEAKIYQDEVLSFMDYCDITNQKRVELTSVFLSIIQNIYRIDALNIVNTKLNTTQLTVDQTKTPYSLKILFLDSYINAKIFFLKLLYLQNKSLSYFTLEKSQFSSKFYKKDIAAYVNDGILDNEKILIDYLVEAGFGRSFDKTNQPIKLTAAKYPLSFQSFIEGDNNGMHTLLFNIEPKFNVLADYKEVFIKSIKIGIDGVTTKGNHLIVKIKHLGNACFIKANTGKSIYFSHKPVVKMLSYNISIDNHSEFSNITGDYLLGGKKPFVELSPFANWELSIDGSANSFTNEGLSLKDVKEINLYFEFYHKPV